MTTHGSEETDGAIDVDSVVLERDLAGFAHGLCEGVSRRWTRRTRKDRSTSRSRTDSYLERGEMNDAVDVRMSDKDPIDRGSVGDIASNEVRPFPADQLDSVQGNGGRVVQVVRQHDLVAGFQKGERREGADITGPATFIPRMSPTSTRAWDLAIGHTP